MLVFETGILVFHRKYVDWGSGNALTVSLLGDPLDRKMPFKRNLSEHTAYDLDYIALHSGELLQRYPRLPR